MKKILLPLFALMLSLTAADAQIAKIDGLQFATSRSVADLNQPKELGSLHKSAKKPAKAQAAATAQKFLAAPGSDQPFTAIGLPNYAGKITKLAQIVPTEYFADYTGSKIVGVRFLTSVATEITPELLTFRDNAIATLVSAPKMTTVATTSSDNGKTFNIRWNEARFTTPYTITSGMDDVLISLGYTQQKSTAQNDLNAMPFIAGQTTDSNAETYAYGQFSGFQSQWANTGLASGNGMVLCAQLIVENENGFADKIVLRNLRQQYTAKTGSKMFVDFAAKNLGENNVGDYSFSIVVDGKELGVADKTSAVDENGKPAANAALGENLQNFTYNLQLPADLAQGEHTIDVVAKSLNGQAIASADASTLEGTFTSWNNSTTRQYNLLEHFTGQACGYCPLGYNMLRELTKQRDDVAWVAVHNYQSKTGDDEYVIDDAAYISQFSMQYLPSANFNRYYYSDDFNQGILATSISYQNTDDGVELANALFDASTAEVPSFVNLEASMKYNQTNGKLSLTVNGKGVEGAADILGDAAITIYVTQNGLKGSQLSYLKAMQTGNNSDIETIKDYDHENVLRQVLTQPYGDDITWSGNDFTFTEDYFINSGWRTGDLSLVIFVSKPLVTTIEGKQYWQLLNNAWVNQCIKLPLKDGSTLGVSGVENNSGTATVVARYSADGTQLSAPVKGVNILKMSDGTTRKVMVNK